MQHLKYYTKYVAKRVRWLTYDMLSWKSVDESIIHNKIVATLQPLVTKHTHWQFGHSMNVVHHLRSLPEDFSILML